MMRYWLASVVLVTLVDAAKLPSNLKICKRNNPKFNECLKEAINGAVPSLVNGIPSLGVLTLDPLHISHLHIGQGDGPVKITLDFKNVKLSGLQTLQVQSASLDTKNYKMTFDLILPNQINLAGPYTIDGKILVLPIKGDGTCNLTLTDIPVSAVIHGEGITKDGETYMNVKTIDLTIDPKHLHLQFENLFNGDKTLGDNMNTFLNENWKDILAELKPAIEAALGETVKEIMNRVFLKVAFKDVFPEK